jgi:SMI1 / KNR4 family (SUKH-1)
MNDKIWNKWTNDWNWILTVAKSRKWDIEPIKIKAAIQISEIKLLENELSISYPTDFKDILVKHSSGVNFGWQISNEETLGEFKQIFCGCGGVSGYRTKSNLWDFDLLSEIYKTYQGWLTDCYNDPTDEYGKHYYDKVPFIEVPNGDLIVFNSWGQVIYLSHDDGPLHGQKLADNFIEFISLWSNLGCVGTESEQFEVFYDEKKQKLMDNDSKIDRWKQWLIK